MNYKLLILVYFFTCSIGFASDFDATSCIADSSAALKVYRDNDDVVRCVHFAPQKSVEYSYNSLKDFKISNVVYKEGALFSKKFHGFTSVSNETLFFPNSNGFYLGVLKEVLSEINQIKRLDEVIAEFYPDPIQQNKLVDEIVSAFYEKRNKEIPEQIKEITTPQKLQYLQLEISQEPDPNRTKETISDLTELDRTKIQNALINPRNKKASIIQCNPRVHKDFQIILSENLAFRQNFKDRRMLAQTFPGNKKVIMALSFVLLDELFDKTILETTKILKNEPIPAGNETIALRYGRTVDSNWMNKEYGNAAIFDRVLVHELGHMHQFVLLGKADSEYKLINKLPAVAGALADEKQFPKVPKKLKKLIESEIIEPILKVMEFSAEAFFVDTVPCIL